MIAALALSVLLAACGSPKPPVGKWEGALDTPDTMVAVRMEMGSDGQVRVSAPDLTGIVEGDEALRHGMRERLSEELAAGWDDVAPRPFDFDGKTFRKPAGVAPQMVWDKATNQMTLELYIGANPALPVVLRPVPEFHDDPFGAG